MVKPEWFRFVPVTHKIFVCQKPGSPVKFINNKRVSLFVASYSYPIEPDYLVRRYREGYLNRLIH